jgi:hypothetical protein
MRPSGGSSAGCHQAFLGRRRHWQGRKLCTTSPAALSLSSSAGPVGASLDRFCNTRSCSSRASPPAQRLMEGGPWPAACLARSLGIVRDLDQELLLATSPSVLTTAAQLLVLRCPRVEASPSLDFPSGTSDAVFRAIEDTVSLFTSSDYLSRNCKSITVIHRPGPHFAGSGSPSPERSRAMPRSSTRMGWRRRCPASSALSERITEL